MQKLHHYRINGIITLKSGTRIGGSDDQLQIGGVDLTCIKDPRTGKPYLPGSSLKGKIRSALEKRFGKIQVGRSGKQPCGCGQSDCPICRIFGPHMNTKHQLGPTRIRVADAMLVDDASFEYEYKTEAIINRDRGSAEHPRPVERVQGGQFKLQIDFEVYDMDEDFAPKDVKGQPIKDPEGNIPKGKFAMLEIINLGIEELENSGIGAGTGKGYGQITIETDDAIELKPKRRLRFADEDPSGDSK